MRPTGGRALTGSSAGEVAFELALPGLADEGTATLPGAREAISVAA